MANPENLLPHRWRPGQSGNPGGRPKKRRLASVLRDLMAEPAGDVPTRTVGERFWQEIIAIAVKHGDLGLIREILDRHDGPIPPPEPPPENMATKTDEELQAIKTGKRRR